MRIFLFVFIMGMSFVINAQNDTLSMDDYFDDDGIASTKSKIKIDGLQFVNGNIPVFYEYAFSKKFGIELGLSLNRPFYAELNRQEFLPVPLREYYDIEAGYGFTIKPEWLFHTPNFDVSLGLLYNQKRSFDETFYNINIFGIEYNYFIQFNNKLFVEYGFSACGYFQEDDVYSNEGALLRLNLRIGIGL